MSEGSNGDRPEFGPSGYLPERASKRARKIVLRAPMGMQWIIGSAVVAVGVLVAGLLFLRTADEPPGPPFVEVGPLATIGEATPLPDYDAVASRAAGRLRVFAVPDSGALPTWCEQTRQLVTDARVWSPTGRGLDGEASLAELPSIVFEGVVYIDPTTTVPGPAPTDEDVTPGCD